MFISPQVAIDKGWITGFTDPQAQVQPNAIDFTLDRLFTITQTNTFTLTKDSKQMRGGDEMLPDSDGMWKLYNYPAVYDGQSDMFVNIPEGVVASLIIRSTLNRNGIFLTSGLYDSGFKGHIAFALHNRSGPAMIEQGVRVGQIMFMTSDSVGQYAGGYNHDQGTHHTEG